jgi:IS5 family transposase
MKAKRQRLNPNVAVGRTLLEFIINLNHELCLLADKINWGRFEQEFAGYFPSTCGNTALSSRLVVGILYLKHAFSLSDEQIVAQWVENPYWQYFCGMEHFQHQWPFHPTSLGKWRKRLGEGGCERLLQELIDVAIKEEIIEKKDLEKIIVDTTVQEKAITYPTDSKLHHRARVLLIKEAKKHGLKLRLELSSFRQDSIIPRRKIRSCSTDETSTGTV